MLQTILQETGTVMAVDSATSNKNENQFWIYIHFCTSILWPLSSSSLLVISLSSMTESFSCQSKNTQQVGTIKAACPIATMYTIILCRPMRMPYKHVYSTCVAYFVSGMGLAYTRNACRIVRGPAPDASLA